MKQLIFLLAFIGLTLSATITVYDVNFEEEYVEKTVVPDQLTYFRAVHDGREDSVYMQFRVLKGQVPSIGIDFCLFTQRPSDDDIINARDYCYIPTPSSFNHGNYDYYRYTQTLKGTYYIGIRVRYGFSGSDIPYFFHSEKIYLDLDSLTRVIYANAPYEQDTVKTAIGYMIVNRSIKMKSTVYEEAVKRNQCFSYWTGDMEPSYKKACENVARACLARQALDYSYGATHYYRGYNVPSWAMGRTPLVVYGDFKFFGGIYPYV
jgi:hypothetical protein